MWVNALRGSGLIEAEFGVLLVLFVMGWSWAGICVGLVWVDFARLGDMHKKVAGWRHCKEFLKLL